MSHATSVQQELIQGKCVDIFYANPETTSKSCIATKQTTKYTTAFNSLAGGTNVFTIPANYGVQGICVELRLQAVGSGAGANLSLSRGWGYALVKNISYRVSGSQQVFVSGAQMLQHALKRMTNQQSKDDLFSLGGSYITGAGFEASTNRAYIFLDLPFSRATSEGMPAPLPTDVLGSQTQITLELNSLSDLIAVNSTGTIPAQLTALASGQFQAQQLLMASRDDSLATRENMATHQLVSPIEFLQQEVVIPCVSGTTSQSVIATGFRSGSVKSIEAWLTFDGDFTSATTRNPLKWYAPTDLQVTYAGDVYAKFDAGISRLWNLINGKSSPYVNGLTTTYSGGYVTTAEQYSWATLPFAQTYDVADTGDFMLVEGLNVTNGIVNINFTTPNATAGWKLHLSYVYNASFVFSQSSCELVF
jgi:hypothetical protein